MTPGRAASPSRRGRGDPSFTASAAQGGIARRRLIELNTSVALRIYHEGRLGGRLSGGEPRDMSPSQGKQTKCPRCRRVARRADSQSRHAVSKRSCPVKNTVLHV